MDRFMFYFLYFLNFECAVQIIVGFYLEMFYSSWNRLKISVVWWEVIKIGLDANDPRQQFKVVGGKSLPEKAYNNKSLSVTSFNIFRRFSAKRVQSCYNFTKRVLLDKNNGVASLLCRVVTGPSYRVVTGLHIRVVTGLSWTVVSDLNFRVEKILRFRVVIGLAILLFILKTKI